MAGIYRPVLFVGGPRHGMLEQQKQTTMVVNAKGEAEYLKKGWGLRLPQDRMHPDLTRFTYVLRIVHFLGYAFYLMLPENKTLRAMKPEIFELIFTDTARQAMLPTHDAEDINRY